MSEISNRLKKISYLKEHADFIVLLSGDPGFFYFTNSDAKGIFVYDFSKPALFVPDMEKEKARKSWVNDIKVFDRLAGVINMFEGRIGVDKKHMPANIFSKLRKCKDVSKSLEQARSVKTIYEISRIKKACCQTKKIFSSAQREITKKTTEQQLAAFVEYEIAKTGNRCAFPAIVAGGANTRIPHHNPENKKLTMPILIDMGVSHDGYKSDVTRTIGHPLQQKIEKIFKELELMIEPGAAVKKIDAAARSMLGNDARYFTHALGHGIGISFEKPYLYNKSKDVLEAGMAFAMEIGVYKRTGIRIENDYLVTDRGFVNLTDF